ncbi:hypothetical protein [Candidatus Cardinium hertigii]|uniref:hypothetical protein n=1 Tax=Candidatus Cardinium hertigii TaxID=247481 RepID=UPI003D7DADF2
MGNIQSEFEKHCKKSTHCQKGEEKSRWLIAKDKKYQYYIHLEEGPACKGAIYRIDCFANSVRFAENFLDFLDKFIKVRK